MLDLHDLSKSNATETPRGRAKASADSRILNVALVNNMSKSAFEATDRQFVRLLNTGPKHYEIRLHRFTLTQDSEDPFARRAGYQPIDALWNSSVDAVMVTGSEPRCAKLSEEAYWPELAALVDWAEANTLSGVWSCLAAHAAALRLDRIERRPIGFKRSGVFSCDIASAHPIVGAWRNKICVPHSRLNELREADLAQSGYQILTRSEEAGADVVLRPGHSLFVLLQGHPEYDMGSLLLEYRRDVRRWIAGEQSFSPTIPSNYFPQDAQADLEKARGARLEAMIDGLATHLTASTSSPWSAWSAALFSNWLSYVSREKASRRTATKTSPFSLSRAAQAT